MQNFMLILPLFWKAICLLRPIFIETFGGCSKQVLLYQKVDQVAKAMKPNTFLHNYRLWYVGCGAGFGTVAASGFVGNCIDEITRFVKFVKSQYVEIWGTYVNKQPYDCFIRTYWH